MPRELQEKFDQIIEEIKNSPAYLEYLDLEKKMKQNQEIQTLISEIKQLQKKLVQLEYAKKDVEEVTQVYQESVQKLHEYPLYVAFLQAQKRVNEDLQKVRFRIENFLDQLVLNSPDF